jgi:hypothetical protein
MHQCHGHGQDHQDRDVLPKLRFTVALSQPVNDKLDQKPCGQAKRKQADQHRDGAERYGVEHLMGLIGTRPSSVLLFCIWIRCDRLRWWRLDYHDRAASKPDDFLGNAAEQLVFEPRSAMGAHNNEVAPKIVENLEDVSGARPLGYDHLMLDADCTVGWLKSRKALPQVGLITLVGVGDERTLFRNDCWAMGHVEENHFSPNRLGKGASGSERLIGV